jgi:hypothetical protein
MLLGRGVAEASEASGAMLFGGAKRDGLSKNEAPHDFCEREKKTVELGNGCSGVQGPQATKPSRGVSAESLINCP